MYAFNQKIQFSLFFFYQVLATLISLDFCSTSSPQFIRWGCNFLGTLAIFFPLYEFIANPKFHYSSPSFISPIIKTMRSILLLSWSFLIPFLPNYFGIQMVLASGQCRSDQQSLLLQMKNSFRLSNDSVFPSTKLSQWSSHQSSDCCDWSGVRCDEAGHVIGLDLSREPIIDGLENATGLFDLQYLQSLNLSFTLFYGFQIWLTWIFPRVASRGRFPLRFQAWQGWLLLICQALSTGWLLLICEAVSAQEYFPGELRSQT